MSHPKSENCEAGRHSNCNPYIVPCTCPCHVVADDPKPDDTYIVTIPPNWRKVHAPLHIRNRGGRQ